MPRRQKNKKYSGELKLKAVQDYLKGGGSLRDICHKYKIKNEKSLREWIFGIMVIENSRSGVPPKERSI